jgi:hypothetical protein
MKSMFNKSKTKAWIKKAHKNSAFGYGYGYITDGYILLIEEQHMQPTILEACGTLNPECKYPAEAFQKLITLPDKAIEVLDSQLEYVSGPKFRLRIFYDPRTGKELAIDGKYFDLIDDPKVHDFYSDDLMSRLWIMYNDKVVGLIGQVRLQEQLSHIKFKAEQV